MASHERREPEAAELLTVTLRLALRDVGGLPEEVGAIGDFTPELVVSVLGRSIELIDGTRVAHGMGGGVAARHRVCTAVARKVKDLGFGGEVGYNELMYPTEASTRALFAWVVGALPRSDEEVAARAALVHGGASSTRRVHGAIATARAESWRLPVRRPKETTSTRWRTWAIDVENSASLATRQVDGASSAAPSLLELATTASIAAARYEASLGDDEDATAAAVIPRLGLIDLGWSDRAAAPSLEELLAEMDRSSSREASSRLGRLAHAARFTHEPPMVYTPNPPAAVAAAAANGDGKKPRDAAEALEAIHDDYAVESAKLDAATAKRGRVEAAQVDAATKLRALTAQGSTLQQEYKVRHRALDMLPDAANHIAKLVAICEAAEQRNSDLLAEWEAHRGPLVASIAEQRDSRARRKARARQMLDEMKRCRAEMQQMGLDIREKDERSTVLEADYAKMPKNVNRALYTYRILDIIGSITKQKKERLLGDQPLFLPGGSYFGGCEWADSTRLVAGILSTMGPRTPNEIAKIIEDIRGVQKAKNKIGETLQRAAALADERVFQDAKSAAGRGDPAMVQSYRYLSELRQLFETIVRLVSEAGAKDRETRDVESKFKQLKSRVNASALDSIRIDLAQIKQENADLVAQLRADRGGR